MNESHEPPVASASSDDLAATPTWVGREDALNQQENRVGRSQANYFLGVLTFAVLWLVWEFRG